MLSNWVWYVLVVISGFVLPPLIDSHQGTALLGIWDLGWAFHSHVGLLAMGVGSAVSCYVARYSAEGNQAALRESVVSSTVLLGGFAALGVIATFVLGHYVHYVLPLSSAAELVAARSVVTLLCIAAAVQLLGSSFNGVITGCERFDVLNLLRGARDLALLVGMVVVLVAGGGVVILAWMALIGEAVFTVVKAIVSLRLCPGLSFSLAHSRVSAMREMLGFGGKTVVQTLSRSGTYQVSAILVAAYLGAQTLAVYARQRALVMHVMRFIKQYAQVFLPACSSLAARGDLPGQRWLLVQSARYATYIALPVCVLLIVFGDTLLDLWMGPDFRAPTVLAVMAIGHALALPQQATFSLSMGLNRHGWPAVVEFGCFVVSVVVGWLLLGPFDAGMLGAAVAMTLPIAISGGVFLPLYMCFRFQMNVADYVRQVTGGPLIANLPFAAGLVATRVAFGGGLNVSVAAGVLICGLLLAATYWQWVIPDVAKTSLRRLLSGFGRILSPASQPASTVGRE